MDLLGNFVFIKNILHSVLRRVKVTQRFQKVLTYFEKISLNKKITGFAKLLLFLAVSEQSANTE